MRYRNISARHKIPIWDDLQFIYVGVDMIEIAQNEQNKMNRIRRHMRVKQYKIYFTVGTSEISNDDAN